MHPLEKNTVALGASIRRKPLDLLMIRDPIFSVRCAVYTLTAPHKRPKAKTQNGGLPAPRAQPPHFDIMPFALLICSEQYNRGMKRGQAEGQYSKYGTPSLSVPGQSKRTVLVTGWYTQP